MSIKLIGIGVTLALYLGLAAYIFVLRADVRSLNGQIKVLDLDLSAATKEVAQCQLDKELSEKVSNDYQKSISALRRQLNSLRNNPTCIPTKPAGKADGHTGAPAGTEFSGGDGVRLGYLADFAGRAEETRLKLLGCQAFVNNLYRSRGENQ